MTDKIKNIQIISDVHTEFGISPEKFKLLLDKAYITVLAGDIVNSASKLLPYLLICKEFSEHIIFICGNHEYYKESTDADYQRVCNSINNVHFLQRNIVTIDNFLFAGCTLWTDISNYAAKLMNDPFSADIIRDKHKIDVEWLNQQFNLSLNDEKVDVLNVKADEYKRIIITHHLPSLKLIHPRYAGSSINSGFASDLDYLIPKINPDLWICGHTHTPFDVYIHKTRFIINPVGYPGENHNFTKKIAFF